MRLTALSLCLLVALPLCATISYGPPSFVYVGSQPSAITTADFNGDCALDFATSDEAGSTERRLSDVGDLHRTAGAAVDHQRRF